MSGTGFGECQKDLETFIKKGEKCHTLGDVVVEKSIDALEWCLAATATCAAVATWPACAGTAAACYARTYVAWHADDHYDDCKDDLVPLWDDFNNCCEKRFGKP